MAEPPEDGPQAMEMNGYGKWVMQMDLCGINFHVFFCLREL